MLLHHSSHVCSSAPAAAFKCVALARVGAAGFVAGTWLAGVAGVAGGAAGAVFPGMVGAAWAAVPPAAVIAGVSTTTANSHCLMLLLLQLA